MVIGNMKGHRSSAARVLRRADRRALAIAYLSFNDLRGSYATEMARAGVPILALAKIMGNSAAQLERTYAQLERNEDYLRELAEKVPRLRLSGDPELIPPDVTASVVTHTEALADADASETWPADDGYRCGFLQDAAAPLLGLRAAPRAPTSCLARRQGGAR